VITLGYKPPGAEPFVRSVLGAIAQATQRLVVGNQSHHGRYFTVENARLYSLPERLLRVLREEILPQLASIAAPRVSESRRSDSCRACPVIELIGRVT
jgi:hypothetical protein